MISESKALCLALLLTFVSRSQQAALIETLTCDLPASLLEWDPNPEQTVFDVHWSYDEEAICKSLHTCNLTDVTNNTIQNATITEKEEVRMRIQLKPVELQPGNKLWFHLEPIANSAIPKVYKVDQKAFLDCDVTGWLPVVTDGQTKQSFEVTEQLLRAGNNYFIVENEGVVRCDMGLRLNVTVKTDSCQRDPTGQVCQGRGRCVTNKRQAAYSCHCCGNYKGSNCDVYDACLSNPCYHGGECLGPSNDTDGNSTRDATGYTCKCTLGYSGDRCEKKPENLCETIECYNGATCTGNATDFHCACPLGYAGSYCEVNIDECNVTPPCRHGQCVDQVDGFGCQCYPGYHGARCEHKHERCMPNPCRNEGVGVNLTVSDTFQWECHCHTMWTGRACTQRAHPCDHFPCAPHGVCEEGQLDFVCRCETGFTGRYCEININDCESNPCQNRGICRDLVNDYSCLCLNAHAGRNCQYTIDIFNPVLDDVHDLDRARRLSEENRNLYIMAGALTMALIIVVTVLLVCYCRRHDDVTEICGIPIPHRKPKHSATNEDLTVNVDANDSMDCPLTSDSFFKNEPGCGPVTNPAFESQVV